MEENIGNYFSSPEQSAPMSKREMLYEHFCPKINDLLNTPEQFIRWAMSIPPGIVVAHARDAMNCPIHNFIKDNLRDEIGYVECTVTGSDVGISLSVDGSPCNITLYFGVPAWVTRFVDKVDYRSQFVGYDPHTLPQINISDENPNKPNELTRYNILTILGELFPENEEILEEERRHIYDEQSRAIERRLNSLKETGSPVPA